MKNHSKIGKRVLAIALSLFMLLSAFPQSVLAAEAEEYAVTKDLNQLLVSAEFKNVDKDSEGNYSIKAGESYTIALSFRENSSLEYDMTDYVYFKLPAGIVANGASGTTNVGVRTAEGLMPIDHDYEIKDNTLYVYWNKDDAYFADLAIAHAVTFNFELTATFDGTTGEVKFNDSNETKVLIDNTGSITITKNVSGLEASLMTEEKKKEMKFELVKVTDGDTPTEEVVKSFTYFEMENGFIKFENMEPGKYVVRETSHPEFTNYTFDRGTDSTLSASGELAIVGSLNLALKNDYDYDRGTLEIGKTFEWKNWKGEVIDMPAGMKDKVSFRVTGPDFNQTYTYANFVDGKLTIKNLKVGIYTITEINNVTGYTWTYSVNNAAADKAETTATVTKDAAAPVSFQNYYKQQTGSLTIKKVGKGAEVPADTVFEVSGPIDKPVTFKYSDMKEVNGEKVYTLTDIPVGTYTVTESKDSAEVASYSLDVTGNGTVSVDVTAGAQAETTITNTYSELGSLKIIKTIAGDLTVDTLTPAQKANIKFTVYNSAGKPVGSLTYAQILDGKDTIEGLPVGKYKVVETGAQISGYTLVYSGDAENLDVVFNDTAKAEFTNTYTKDVFELTITKELVKEGSFVAELKDLPDSILTGTTYAVKDSKGKTVKVNVGGTEKSSFTLKELLAAGGKVTVTGTNAGPYKITETNPTVVGVGITTTVAVTNAKAVTENKGTSVKVELENGKTAAVTFSNKYEAQGLIKGDKKIEGLYAHEADKVKANIRFTIYKVEAGVISEYKDNVTLAQLTAGIVVPAGTYFVREVAGAGVIGYDLITNTQVEEETIKVDEATERFVVPQAGTVNIKFTNIYTRGTEGGGELVLNKYVQGLDEIKSLDPELLDEKSIYENGNGQKLYDVITFILEEKVQVNGQDTWLKYGTYSLKQFTDGEVKLPAGTFRITEENGDVKGYLLHVDYLIKSGTSAADQTSSKSMEFTIDQGTTIDMKVTNVYSHIGSLTITKTVEGKTLTATEKKNIKFTVTGPFDFKKEFTYNDMVGGVMTFSDIPVGTYYVTESGATIANYTLAVSSTGLTEGTPVSGQNLTGSVEVVSEGSSVGIKNSYSRDKGTLVIKKVMEGEAPTDMTREQMHCMKFEVRTNNQSNDSTPLYTIYYDQFTDGTYTIENVNTGTYKVSEIIDGVLTNDYTISVSDSGKGNVSATVTKGGTSTITVTNTFIKTGSLKIVKEFEGAELTSAEKASVKFVITGPNNYERTA
ncbi:MAG: hypothetical protein HUJ69_04810, partial [Lachnospiraceae bacterium]|nr:hypothetical protein [Lachnospiraceae bacterium]